MNPNDLDRIIDCMNRCARRHAVTVEPAQSLWLIAWRKYAAVLNGTGTEREATAAEDRAITADLCAERTLF